MILLLDEPGLTLHAKAQRDLLRYFETELKGSHQLIYSTHSPFMIDPTHFERVRIVQEKSIDAELNVDIGKDGTTVLEAMSATGLDPRWTIAPVGGSAKVPTFVALLGSQKGMTIATLIDSQTADQKKIEGLYREKLLKKANVMTFADFTKTAEADMEDMFGAEFYIDLVNAEI
jgi:energy-coupling factor transporter ATP-binding protein EcfA2